jgi:pimeloyl-ACP methyl ester carboxylesterase
MVCCDAMRAPHCIIRVLSVLGGLLATALLATEPAHSQEPVAPTPGDAIFNVFVRSTPVGFERATLIETADGWIIRSSGQLGPPIDIDNRFFEAEYDREWHPRRVVIDGIAGGESFSLDTSIVGATATSTLTEGTERSTSTETIDPASILLPNNFFAAYEALAARLSGAESGAQLPVHMAPRGQVVVVVNSVRTQEIETTDERFAARIYSVTFQNPGQPFDAEIWIDSRHRLLRVSLPTVGLDIARQDITLVSTRLANISHPGDETVRIPSSGFSLTGTLTTPVDREAPAGGRWPTVVLVAGAGPGDRDETVAGIPIFGQLAGALADAGFLVLRYDKRGIGQSGGRPESADLDDYAEDLREVVRYLDDRDDVDRDRIAVVGHSEGGWIGLLTAARERKVGALALIATPGTSGAELVLEQQRHELIRLRTSPAEQEAKIALQLRIHEALVGDGAWDDVPDGVRRQADTPWFRSLLEFEPSEVVPRVRQPLLVVQGSLDSQVPPHHADRLEKLATARTRSESTVEVARLEGLNHLLVPATTGDVDEYARLGDRSVSAEIVAALTDWLSGAAFAYRD